jgi:hypothetical protein
LAARWAVRSDRQSGDDDDDDDDDGDDDGDDLIIHTGLDWTT